MRNRKRTTEQEPAADHGGAEVIPLPLADPRPVHPEDPEGPVRVRPKIRWLRLISLVSGLGVLACVSTVFGMMMAVAADLPKLDAFDKKAQAQNSVMVDRQGKELGKLTGNESRILVKEGDVAPVMKHAIIAIEDRRFYTNPGVDIRGIGRALWQDVVQRRIVQGGSTITQQFVKNALAAQDDRTLFQKLRESAMAYHMTRKWDKARILNAYLNTIYFGNGAYGIELAAKVYFGQQHLKCGTKGERLCAQQLEAHEAALIAGIVASPSGYDPVAHPEAAKARRDLVLLRMTEQGFISRAQYERSRLEALPSVADIQPPVEESDYPYFTTWVRQQVVDQVGAQRAFEGDLRVRTTIDSKLQDQAQAAVNTLTGLGPEATLVAIHNDTGEVRAMVSGLKKYKERPFNLATQGQRQPGSAFKPFILAEALKRGISPTKTFTSKKKSFCVTKRKGKCIEAFEVNNYEDAYAGVTNLTNATYFSDNSVYAELGINLKTTRIARLAERMGIRTPVSTNPAMTLGGLKEGVTTLDMAHAYQTFAEDGELVYGSLSPGANDRNVTPGPVGIRDIVENGKDGEVVRENTQRRRRVIPYGVAQDVEGILSGVVKFGTAKRAALGPKVLVAGKTGTTENYGDAWFVGWTKEYTVAVWVGYPDELRPMQTEFAGEPVAGGTYPAMVWQAFMKQVQAGLDEARLKREQEKNPDATPTPGGSVPAPPTGSATPVPDEGDNGEAAPRPKPQQQAPEIQAEPQQDEPAEPEPQQPAPQEPPADPGGSGGATPPPSGDPPQQLP